MIYIKLPDYVDFVLRRLNEYGYDAYIVGGCVRDSVARREPHDWDVCTNALPEHVCRVFSDCMVMKTGIKHGTVTVMAQGESVEITTFRLDGTYSDGRHPDDVQFTKSLCEDLARRDFTMNAMAYHPDKGLIDPFHGQEDLRNHLIRCVGNPNTRFGEDALRILRAVRFAARFHYAIDKETARAMTRQAPNLVHVSKERVQSEFMGLLAGEHAPRILADYYELFYPVIPEIQACVGFEQNNPYHVYDVWQHTLEALWETSLDPTLRLAVFFHDIGKPRCYEVGEDGYGHFHGHGKVSAGMARDIMTRLRFSNEVIENVCQLVEVHDRFIEPNEKSVRRLLAQLGPEQFERFLELRQADILAQNPDFSYQRLDKIANIRAIVGRIAAHNDCLGLADLAVGGRDLLSLGYQAGPGLGQELHRLLDLVLDDPSLNVKDTLLQLAAEDLKKAI